MERFKAVNVFMGGQKVGTLATYKNYRTAFEYSDSWLQAGFSISPLSLPLQKKDDLLAVADHIGLASCRAKEIVELVRTVVAEVLGDVNRFA